jgi:hypothetical protein
MKYQGELSIAGACGGYSKTPAKHAPAVGNSVLNSLINNLGSGSIVILVPALSLLDGFALVFAEKHPGCILLTGDKRMRSRAEETKN